VASGVSSIGIVGDGRDRLEVVGDGMDVVCLVHCLRKKLGHAELLMMGDVKDKEARPEPVVVVNTEEARPADDKRHKPVSRRRRARKIFTKLLPKFVWSRTRTSISPPALSPAASHSHLFPDVLPSSTAVVMLFLLVVMLFLHQLS